MSMEAGRSQAYWRSMFIGEKRLIRYSYMNASMHFG
jgi:hypothetical protein